MGPLRPVPWCKHPYVNKSTDRVLEGLDDSLSPEDELSEYCMTSNYERFVKDVIVTNNFHLKYFTGPPIHIVTCCALLRSKIIDKVGGIADLDYKVFGAEDTDLSWRISTNGYHIAVTSDVYVHHFKHKSSGKNKLDRNKFLRKNNLIFYRKWKDVIRNFLDEEVNKGVDIIKLLSDESSYEYWFLRRLSENIGYQNLLNGVKIR